MDTNQDGWPGVAVTDDLRDPATERLAESRDLRRRPAIPLHRPGVEFTRAMWVVVILAFLAGLTIVAWVFWWIFVGYRTGPP